MYLFWKYNLLHSSHYRSLSYTPLYIHPFTQHEQRPTVSRSLDPAPKEDTRVIDLPYHSISSSPHYCQPGRNWFSSFFPSHLQPSCLSGLTAYCKPVVCWQIQQALYRLITICCFKWASLWALFKQPPSGKTDAFLISKEQEENKI